MIPVQHQHVQRRLAAAVANRFEVQFLRPTRREGRGGEVRFGGLCDVGEAGDEDEARVGGLEEQGHECPGEDVGAGDVDVVGLREAGAEGDFAGEEFDVEGCACGKGETFMLVLDVYGCK